VAGCGPTFNVRGVGIILMGGLILAHIAEGPKSERGVWGLRHTEVWVIRNQILSSAGGM